MRKLLLILLFLAICQVSISYANNSICSDATFIRRASLALTGRIPSPNSVKNFLADSSLNKRFILINSLVGSEEYCHYMTMRWGDIFRIKSEFPSNLWPNGVQAYNRWIFNHIQQNTPYNEWVEDLLISYGSNFKSPATNFYRAFQVRTSDNIYSNIILIFLGKRAIDDEGSFCFQQLRHKSTKEWKEEILYLNFDTITKSEIKLIDGTILKLEKNKDHRIPYVKWLVRDERFATVITNRMHYWLTGKSFIPEPDLWSESFFLDIPIELQNLTNSFIKSGYDLNKLITSICLSHSFQSIPSNDSNYKIRRLPAEIIIDALADITGYWPTYLSRVPEPFTVYPDQTRAIELGDGTVSSPTLELFGKSSRDASLESNRNNSITSRQLLFLMNSSELERQLIGSKKLKAIYHRKNSTIQSIAKEISLLCLSRKPTKQEITLYQEYARVHKLSKKQFAIDLTWMQINSIEFLTYH